jgi:hypothetical protein
MKVEVKRKPASSSATFPLSWSDRAYDAVITNSLFPLGRAAEPAGDVRFSGRQSRSQTRRFRPAD